MVNLKKDNDNNNQYKYTGNDVITFILGVATIVVSAATIYQEWRINQQQSELNQAKQNAELKLGLFDRVVTSIEKKEENKQKILLVLLDSLDE